MIYSHGFIVRISTSWTHNSSIFRWLEAHLSRIKYYSTNILLHTIILHHITMRIKVMGLNIKLPILRGMRRITTNRFLQLSNNSLTDFWSKNWIFASYCFLFNDHLFKYFKHIYWKICSKLWFYMTIIWLYFTYN